LIYNRYIYIFMDIFTGPLTNCFDHSPMDKSLINNNILVASLLDDAYACRINDLKRSLQLTEKALKLSRESNSEALIGRSLNHLSLFYMIMGEYTSSVDMAKEAIGYFENLKDVQGIADAKYSIAGVYYKTDNYHLGLIYLIDCLAIYQKFDDHHNQARVHKSLGTIYEYFGDQKNAVLSYEKSIESAIKVGDVNLQSNAYNPLSGIYLKQGNVEKALELIERSIVIKTQSGDIRGLGFALYGRGKVFANQGRLSEAEIDFKKSLEIHTGAGDRLGIGMAYHKLATVYVEMGKFKEAKAVIEKTLQFGTENNIVIIKFKCDYLLYRIYKQENNTIKALEYLERYLVEKEAVINTQTLKVIENYELITKMESIEKEAQAQREKAEIIEKKDRAEQSARVKQEFLSTMSHEIRTPLNAVITITTLLKDKSDEEDKQLLDSLKFASNNLLLIINDILDFTKLDTGKVQLESRPCNLTTLLENIKRTYETLAKEKGLKLTLKTGIDIAHHYEIDETKLSQILGNLIGNAIKYTDTGDVAIEIERMGGNQYTDVLRFKITDTGVGIPESYFDEMFDSFSQPKSITTRKQGGSGLGLAIVKKLVELYGSTVNFSSVVGEGSVFYFDLQLKRSGVPIQSPSRRSTELKDKLVLLAEDNMINAMVARKLLSNWGIVTEHAKDGLEAIEKSKTKPFDFILMDIHMPEMNGYDATAHIRKNEGPNLYTPIFALTADITAEHDNEYYAYFNGFLRKPIEIDKLYEALITA
jgi:signal transduction histidine kinase